MLFVFDVGQAGNQNHRDALGQDFLLQFLQQGKAVHTRHHDIQQDQGILRAGGLPQPVLRRLDNGDIVLVFQN